MTFGHFHPYSFKTERLVSVETDRRTWLDQLFKWWNEKRDHWVASYWLKSLHHLQGYTNYSFRVSWHINFYSWKCNYFILRNRKIIGIQLYTQINIFPKFKFYKLKKKNSLYLKYFSNREKIYVCGVKSQFRP